MLQRRISFIVIAVLSFVTAAASQTMGQFHNESCAGHLTTQQLEQFALQKPATSQPLVSARVDPLVIRLDRSETYKLMIGVDDNSITKLTLQPSFNDHWPMLHDGMFKEAIALYDDGSNGGNDGSNGGDVGGVCVLYWNHYRTNEQLLLGVDVGGSVVR